MSRYKVTDPSSGRKVTLTGDSPPTEQELEEIFAKVGPGNPATPEEEKKGGGFWNNAKDMALETVGWIGNKAASVSTAPIAAGLSAAQDVATRDPEASTLSQIPEGLAAFGRGFAGQIGRDPSRAPSYEKVLTRAGVSDEPSPRMKQVNGNWVPGIPDNERQQGTPIDGKPNYIGPDQGVYTSPAKTLGTLGEAVTPLFPGLGAAKVIAGPAAKMIGESAQIAAKAADVATGTKVAGKAVGSVKNTIKGLQDAYTGARDALKSTFDPKQSPDFEKSVATAVRNDIDPKLLNASHEFGPTSHVTKMEKFERQGPLGDPLEKQFDEGMKQTRDALRRDIEKIGGGAPLSRPAAGDVLRDGYNEGVKRAFDAIETSHKTILAEVPDLVLSRPQMDKLGADIAALEAWGKAKASTGATKTAKEQGMQVLRSIRNIKNAGNVAGEGETLQKSYAGIYGALKDIGDIAFKATNTTNDIPADIAKFRQLYGHLNDALINTVEESLPAGRAKSLVESNQAMTKIFGDRALLGEIGEKATAGEDLFQSIIEHGDTKRLEALKAYLDPKQLQQLKGTFLDNLIKPDIDGNFSFRTVFNRLNTREKQEIAAVLFDPGELDNFGDVMKLGADFGPRVLSHSGTGASNQLMDFVKTVKNRAVDKPVAEHIKSKARAIGFNTEENGAMSIAARPGQRPPTMGFGPGGQVYEGLSKFNPRTRAARSFSLNRDDEEN